MVRNRLLFEVDRNLSRMTFLISIAVHSALVCVHSADTALDLIGTVHMSAVVLSSTYIYEHKCTSTHSHTQPIINDSFVSFLSDTVAR